MIGACFYVYHITRSPHQKSSIDWGTKLTVSSEKQSYKEGESFTIDIRVKNLEPRVVGLHKPIICDSLSLFLELDEEIKTYYDATVIDSQNRPPGDCVPQAEDSYYDFLPGQTIYEKILFTPKNATALPKEPFKMNIVSSFDSAVVVYPISISSSKEENK